MMDHIGQNGAGVLVVPAQLRAAVVVRESHNGINARMAGILRLEALHNLLADAVHTTHCGDHPYLVADAHLTVCSFVSFEGYRF